MPVILEDAFVRKGSPVRSLHNRTRGALLFVLAFVSVALLVLSRLDHVLVRGARAIVTDLALPLIESASIPARKTRELSRKISDYMNVLGELERLRAENGRLKQWEWRARELERRLHRYSALVNAVPEKEAGFVTARVVADGRGAFLKSVLVNAGSGHGLTSTSAVVNADGLVGRLVDVYQRSARVLLVTDLNSRIPVLVGDEGVRAILAGDNTSLPKLRFLPLGKSVEPGDVVVTSGHGGIFPPGLRIGMISDAASVISVKPFTDLNALDYVSILLAAPAPLEVSSAGEISVPKQSD